MSFLYPLFLLGGAAIAGPILFHLIRRVTREKKSFSTLMFLKASPPKLTRKSRIEHWFLMLLRCLVFLLLALAFSRPYLSSEQTIQLESDERVRHCLLIDKSASMRRDGLWEESLSKAENWLTQWKQEAYASVYLFDESIHQVVSFEDWSGLNPDIRTSEILNRIKAQPPSWKATSIDDALLESLNRMEEGAREQEKENKQQAWELVVISDLQSGSRYEGLRGQDWPKHAYVVFDGTEPRNSSNAGLQALQSDWQIAEDESFIAPRVRVSNAQDSDQEQFEIQWKTEDNSLETNGNLPMYVTPGQTRITTAPKWPEDQRVNQLVLTGDSETFDNTIWIAPFKPRTSRIVLLAPKGQKQDSELEYYIERAFQSIPEHRIELIQSQTEAWEPLAALKGIDLWIVTRPLNDSVAEGLREQVKKGGIILMPITSVTMQNTLQVIWEDPVLEIEEATVTDYSLIGKIDFQHPLFAPFADPRFSNFSKIHFWKHRRILNLDLSQEELRIAAYLDNDEPAIITRSQGLGRIILISSSWTPKDSQLALSTKFVPWLYTALNWGRNYQELRTQYSIGEAVDLSSIPTEDKLAIRNPNGEVEKKSADKLYRNTNLPGIYEIEADNDFRWTFAVNLHPDESRTSVLPLETLESLGVPTRDPENAAEETPESRQQKAEDSRLLQSQEIEQGQKYWRWMLLAVLALVLVESLVASKASPKQFA